MKVCDEDIVLFFYIVDNLYKLPRPMLFPTTSMISVSTNKIKKNIYFIFLLQIKSKSMILVSTNKNKNILFFLLQIKSKSMISVFTNKNKNILLLLQIKTKSQANLIKSIHISWWILFYNTKTSSFYTFWPKNLPHQLM